MKKPSTLLTLLIFVFSANAFGQNSPKNARDFFAALPSEFMTGTRAERLGAKDKSGYVMPQSVTSDYLKFVLFENNVPPIVKGSLDVPQSMGELKLFRGKNKTIVGLSFQVSDKNEPQPTTDKVYWHTFLLEYKDGKWTNLTESLMPKVSVDEAYKVLTENFQMKDVKKEDVRVEAQLNKDKNLLLFVAKRKGDESVTTLKLFKWTTNGFVETAL